MKPADYMDALLSLPGMYKAHVSRDDKWVAWTWYRTGPAADVYVAPTDGSTPPTAPDRHAGQHLAGLLDAR